MCIPAARHSFTAAECLYKAALFCLSRGIQEKNIPANLPCVSQIIMEGFFKFFFLIGVWSSILENTGSAHYKLTFFVCFCAEQMNENWSRGTWQHLTFTELVVCFNLAGVHDGWGLYPIAKHNQNPNMCTIWTSVLYIAVWIAQMWYAPLSGANKFNQRDNLQLKTAPSFCFSSRLEIII